MSADGHNALGLFGKISGHDPAVYLADYGTSPDADVTAAWLSACAAAQAKGAVLVLPPYNVQIAQTGVVRGIIGTFRKSKITLAPDFTKTGFGTQFCILNPSFAQAYSGDSSADEVLFRDFDIVTSPNAGRSIIGLANVSGGLISRVNITANQVIQGGKPVAVDSLIDLYACVKKVRVERCVLQNITGAYGATKVAAGGGGCMWVRNLSSNGSTAANVTEDIEVAGNTLYHLTSDEAFAVYGVRGVTRRVQFHNNRVYGLDSTGAYHNTLISVFPLDDGSGANLGNTAAVYDVDVTDNIVSDRSFLYSVLRIGNTGDAARQCYNIKSARNKITAFRSSDASTGPKAIWTAAGATGSDPDTASIVLRCIDGTQGTAYSGSYSGNVTEGDEIRVTTGGSQTNAAISSFQKVSSPVIMGDVFTGVASCVSVTGGQVEAFARAFYNCNHVTGATWRTTGSGSTIAGLYVDSALGGTFVLENTRGVSGGALIVGTASLVSGTRLCAFGNTGSLGAQAALNGQTTNATITAHLNDFGGSATAITTGTATFSSTLNHWGASLSD